MIWDLVNEGKATLQELETVWTMDDVYRMVAVLSMNRTIESLENERLTKQ